MTLPDHRRDDFLRFGDYVRIIDEVIECHLVNGGYDYLLKVMTRGVETYFSFIVIKGDAPVCLLQQSDERLIEIMPA